MCQINWIKTLDRVDCDFAFSGWQKPGYGVNSFTWIKLRSPTSSLELKRMVPYLTLLFLYEEFARGVYSQCCYTLLQVICLPISLIRIKGMQIRVHEIKVVNFANDTTKLLRAITSLNRIQVILKLYKDASTSKINFSKVNLYGLGHIKIELINQDNCNSQRFPLKYLELLLVTLCPITPIVIK